MSGVRGQEDVERRQLLKELRDQKQHVQRHKEVLCDISNNCLENEVRRLDTAVDKGAALSLHCLLGPMDAKPKERKVAGPRQKRQALGELERPEEHKEEAEENKQDTDRNMEIMWEIIQAQKEPLVRFIELVLNPNCFSQTVENMFTLSFLVRDNRVQVLSTEKGLCIRALDPKKPENSGKGQQTQFVVALHTDDWHKMRQKVAPERCLMPHRQQEDGIGAQGAKNRRNKKQRS
ncbi:hypothetical protein GPECTOR_54g244 [Gonium pectorale]|uniref:Non-structural maintenance of chromosomes element 4 n=1 Tax=Gonium pectorale TaxID=33097 RepID=A0A150G6N1_GONPE|nr:hypothetical protein GPECTOR_54g244 [Gonium pectorale]|eukprot:KXZ45502.1 hypothetical protein GPECTOR_54g244 [Gonium pectorale]